MASAPGTLLTSVRSFNGEEEGEDEGGVRVQIKRRDSSSWLPSAPEAVSCQAAKCARNTDGTDVPELEFYASDRSESNHRNNFRGNKTRFNKPCSTFQSGTVVVGRHRVFGCVHGN